MECFTHRAQIIEFLRSKGDAERRPSALAAHIEKCVDCANFQRTQVALATAFESFGTCSGPQWSDELPPRLLRELDAGLYSKSSLGRNRSVSTLRVVIAATAAAAAIIVVTPLLVQHDSAPKRDFRTAYTNGTRGEFVQLPYVASLAPYEYEQVRRMTVPVATLLAYGLSIDATADEGAVTADVVFGQDGRALAVRVLSASISKNDGNVVR